MSATSFLSSRRRFLQAATLAATATPMAWMQALAASNEDYRALVCIFLYGGNDGNNTLIPTDGDTYATYAAGRAALALPSASLAPLGVAASQGGRAFGLHPGLAAIAPLYRQGKLALLANVGTLVLPMTVADYKAKSKRRPDSLFSHVDQQNQWQTAKSTAISITGWGGAHGRRHHVQQRWCHNACLDVIGR